MKVILKDMRKIRGEGVTAKQMIYKCKKFITFYKFSVTRFLCETYIAQQIQLKQMPS